MPCGERREWRQGESAGVAALRGDCRRLAGAPRPWQLQRAGRGQPPIHTCQQPLPPQARARPHLKRLQAVGHRQVGIFGLQAWGGAGGQGMRHGSRGERPAHGAASGMHVLGSVGLSAPPPCAGFLGIGWSAAQVAHDRSRKCSLPGTCRFLGLKVHALSQQQGPWPAQGRAWGLHLPAHPCCVRWSTSRLRRTAAACRSPAPAAPPSSPGRPWRQCGPAGTAGGTAGRRRERDQAWRAPPPPPAAGRSGRRRRQRRRPPAIAASSDR